MKKAESILDKSKAVTVKDLKKILKKLPDDALVKVPSHCSNGYYQIWSTQIEFDDEKIHIGD